MKKCVLILSVAFISIFLQGCSLSDKELLRDFAQAWAEANAVKIGVRTLFGSSGDDHVDAALDAYDSIKPLMEADKLMEEGKKSHNMEKMDEAIDRRPDDWSYRVSRSVLHLEQGDISRFDEDRTKARDLAGDNSRAASQITDQMIAELKEYLVSGPRGEQCLIAYQTLSDEYATRYNRTQDPNDLARSKSYFDQGLYCGD